MYIERLSENTLCVSIFDCKIFITKTLRPFFSFEKRRRSKKMISHLKHLLLCFGTIGKFYLFELKQAKKEEYI